MKWLDWPARAHDFLSDKLWEIEPEQRSRLSAIRLLQFTIMLAEGFVRDHLLLRASALSYFTVLSLVPLLAVAVAIASAVGVGSSTFIDWVVGAFAAGAPEAETTIRNLIAKVDFTGLGAVGGGILFVTTVLAISNVESTLNDIWGLERGRSWARRFSDYLAVLVVAPLLVGAALSLAGALESQWAVARMGMIPVLRHFVELGGTLVPLLMLSTVFVFLYWFMPNTAVDFTSAAIGGVVAGVLVTGAQNVYVNFSVGVARADAFFGGFALLPLLFAWIYLFWAIVLFGAEIAFAHQNFTLYRQEVQGKPATSAEREAIGVRIALDVALQFGSGGRAPDAEDLADSLQVPVRTVRSVTADLLRAGILSQRSEADRNDALQLGRPADRIRVSDLLEALRGRRDPKLLQDPAGQIVSRTCDELEAAAGQVARTRSLADLVDDLAGGAPPADVATLPTGDVDPNRAHG